MHCAQDYRKTIGSRDPQNIGNDATLMYLQRILRIQAIYLII